MSNDNLNGVDLRTEDAVQVFRRLRLDNEEATAYSAEETAVLYLAGLEDPLQARAEELAEVFVAVQHNAVGDLDGDMESHVALVSADASSL